MTVQAKMLEILLDLRERVLILKERHRGRDQAINSELDGVLKEINDLVRKIVH
jgi:hypothetical protein